MAYVAAGSDGVRVFNVANPALPMPVGSMPDGTNACAVAVVSNLLHVAAGQHGLVLADLATPTAPAFQGRYTEAGFGAVRGVAAMPDRAVITDGDRLKLINTAAPALLDTYDAPGYVYALAWHGSHLYVAAGHAGIITLDMGSPSVFGSTHQLAVPGISVDIAAWDGYAHVASSTGRYTLDLVTPGAPTLADSDTSGGALRVLAVADDLLHMARSNPDVLTHSVTNPLTPVAAADFGAVLTALDIASAGTRAIVSEGRDGFALLNILGTDADGDGLDDDVERTIIDAEPDDGFRTLLDVEPDDDFDGDGLSNLAEEIAGTSAADASSVLAIAAAGESPGGGFELRWHSVAGRTYAVPSSTNLTAGFTLLEGGIAADPPMNIYPTTVSEAATFFIIVIEP